MPSARRRRSSRDATPSRRETRRGSEARPFPSSTRARQWPGSLADSREFVPALLSFNLGVEAGQLTVIGIALALFGLPFREKIWYRSRIVVPASITIAAIGFYWSVERVLIR